MTIEKAIYQLEDLIKDRESFVDNDYDLDNVFRQDIEACKKGIKALKKISSVGKWKAENTRPKSPMFVCSLCGKKAYDRPYGSAKHMNKKACKLKYCPNCGARMEGIE